MNIVAAINKFINSKNPSQSSFMPLDALIRNQNVLYASDNLHRMLYSGENTYDLNKKTNAIISLSKFMATNTGTCKIKLLIWTEAHRYSSNTYVRIKRNGNIIMSINTTP